MNKTFGQYMDDAAHGVLSDLHIGGDGTGVIPATAHGKLTHLFNQAVRALYTRFPLRRASCEIEQHEGQYLYPLRLQYAQLSGSAEPVKFILDEPSLPFEGRVLKIEHIFNDEGLPLPINDQHDERSWFTPVFDTLRTLAPVDLARLHVEYRMGPAGLVNLPSLEDLRAQVVELPDVLGPAFLAHVGYLAYNGMNMEGSSVKAGSLRAEYEMECLLVETQDLLGTSETVTNVKPAMGGWI